MRLWCCPFWRVQKKFVKKLKIMLLFTCIEIELYVYLSININFVECRKRSINSLWFAIPTVSVFSLERHVFAEKKFRWTFFTPKPNSLNGHNLTRWERYSNLLLANKYTNWACEKQTDISSIYSHAIWKLPAIKGYEMWFGFFQVWIFVFITSSKNNYNENIRLKSRGEMEHVHGIADLNE